jgi:FkbM family methyltransferase
MFIGNIIGESSLLQGKCFWKRHLTYKVNFARTLSQAKQDLWVIEDVFAYKRNGFFLELGSADGLTLSNTYLLERRYNWNGICIEANPSFYKQAVINRKAKVINACVDDSAGFVRFSTNGLLGGIIDVDTDNFDGLDAKTSAIFGETVSIPTIPLVDILEQNQVPKVIDYFSIDIEGAETRVLKNFPFDQYTFLAITIERPSKELENLLERNGYILVKTIPWLDSFYIHESHQKQYADNLAYYSKAFFSHD